MDLSKITRKLLLCSEYFWRLKQKRFLSYFIKSYVSLNRKLLFTQSMCVPSPQHYGLELAWCFIFLGAALGLSSNSLLRDHGFDSRPCPRLFMPPDIQGFPWVAEKLTTSEEWGSSKKSRSGHGCSDQSGLLICLQARYKCKHANGFYLSALKP